MGPKDLLLCSHNSVTGLCEYTEPDKFILLPHVLFKFYSYPYIYTWILRVISSLKVFQPKFVMHFCPLRSVFLLLLACFYLCHPHVHVSVLNFTSDLTNILIDINQSIMNEYVSNMKFILWM